MMPSTVRARVLREHQAIRDLSDRIYSALGGVRAGDTEGLHQARMLHEWLRERFAAHVELEEAILAPTLRDADDWGAVRVAQLCEHQRAQRRALDSVDAWPAASSPDFAGRLVHCLAQLRIDIRREEADLFDPDVLRDDVTGIDVEAG
jgi:hypothetical protein